MPGHCLRCSVERAKSGEGDMIPAAQMMPMGGFCWGCMIGWAIAVALLVFIVVAVVKLVKKERMP